MSCFSYLSVERDKLMNHRVIIVIPTHKKKFNDLEKISLSRLREVLSNFPITFLVPESMPEDFGKDYPEFSIKRVSDNCFGTVFKYDKMCLSPDFYEWFPEYEYMLIYQTDAFVFEDRLLEFCDMDYDYMGASWECPPPYWVHERYYKSRVGNGGFSLRRIQKCLEMTKKYVHIIREWFNPEDVFFAYCADYLDPAFRVAPREIAWKFSMETFPQYIYRCNGNQLSFGCHGWHKVDSVFFFNIISKYGFDLTPYKAWMSDMDGWDHQTTDNYEIEGRLLYRKKYIDLLSKYNHNWIFLCLDDYGFDLADKLIGDKIDFEAIYGIGLEQWTLGIHSIKPITNNDLHQLYDTCFLLLGSDEEGTIVELESNGWEYGKEFVSLKREYINFLEGSKQDNNETEGIFCDFIDGSRILIYGAGTLGRSCYAQLAKSPRLSIAGLIDQAAGDKYFCGFPVEPIDVIKGRSFDYCLITVRNVNTATLVKNNLMKMGIEAQKLLWIGSISAKL